ncbi:MAG: DnaA/Hda family protein, partial [Pseudomonadota bacterium]
MAKKTDDAIWSKARDLVRLEIGRAAWARWIEPLSCSGVAGDTALLVAPSDFAADWVNRHYAEEVVSSLNEAGARCAKIAVTACADDAAKKGAAPLEARSGPRDAAGTPLSIGEPTDRDAFLRSAALDSRFTFDGFVIGRPNELAYAAARRVAEDDSVVYNPVFLHGGVGLGKTHLMHAIAWRIAERAPARKVLYLSAEQF